MINHGIFRCGADLWRDQSEQEHLPRPGVTVTEKIQGYCVCTELKPWLCKWLATTLPLRTKLWGSRRAVSAKKTVKKIRVQSEENCAKVGCWSQRCYAGRFGFGFTQHRPIKLNHPSPPTVLSYFRGAFHFRPAFFIDLLKLKHCRWVLYAAEQHALPENNFFNVRCRDIPGAKFGIRSWEVRTLPIFSDIFLCTCTEKSTKIAYQCVRNAFKICQLPSKCCF